MNGELSYPLTKEAIQYSFLMLSSQETPQQGKTFHTHLCVKNQKIN